MKKINAAGGPIVLHIDARRKRGKKRSAVKDFVWDKMQFVVISAFVFVLAYGFLNYQAVLENARFQWRNFRGDAEKIASLEQTRAEGRPLRASVLSSGFSASGVKKDAGDNGRGKGGNKGVLNKGAADLRVLAYEPESSIPIPKFSAPVYPPDTRLVIPRILKNIPIVGASSENLINRDWSALEKELQEALRNGVVHYPGTALPGEIGNIVFTGHSSFYAWDPGRFKDVFALLHEVKAGDRIYVFHSQKRYEYEVFDIRVVKPHEVDVLAKTKDERLTLITCTPLGTNLKRLVLTAKRVP